MKLGIGVKRHLNTYKNIAKGKPKFVKNIKPSHKKTNTLTICEREIDADSFPSPQDMSKYTLPGVRRLLPIREQSNRLINTNESVQKCMSKIKSA